MHDQDFTKLTILRYRRKSTDDEDRQVASLGDQDTDLDELNERLNISPSQMLNNVEEARTAKKAGRPLFNDHLIKVIQEGKANAIQAWHPNRISRNVIDTAAVINLMDEGKLLAVISTDRTYWNTPLDKFMLAFACSQAKLENDDRSLAVLRHIRKKLRKGVRPSGVPVGYLYDRRKPPGERILIPDPKRFEQVRKLWDLLLSGKHSVRDIQRIAKDELRLRTRRTKKLGGKPLSLSHVYSIFRNPLYYGSFWWKDPDTGEQRLYTGVHKPMITDDEYWQAQVILGHTPRPRPRKHHSPYARLIRCGECDCTVVFDEKWQIICGSCKYKFAVSRNRSRCPQCGEGISDMRNKKILHYIYYHCTKKKNPFCSQKAIRVENLEAQIDEFLKGINIGEKYMRWAINEIQRETTDETKIQKRADASIKRERTKLKEELRELHRFIIKQENAGWTMMDHQDAMAERKRLQHELTKIEGRQGKNNERALDWFDSSVNVLNFACRARYWFENGTPEAKREILQTLGSNLVLKDKKLAITLDYPLPEIAEMIKIDPRIAAWLEPEKSGYTKRRITASDLKNPALLRRLNAIRTYFMSTSEVFRCPDFAKMVRSAC